MTHADRRCAAWAAMIEQAPEADAFLVTGWANVRYLTGFTGSNGCLILRSPDDAVLGTDGRYVVQAADEAPGLPTHIDRATVPSLVDAWAGGARLAIEGEHLTVAVERDLAVRCAETLMTSGVVESLRAHKEPAEVEAIARACEITDAALAAVLPRLMVGVTERQVARWLISAMEDAGAQGPAFDPIVGAGPHSAIPHHQPTDRELQAGDLVVMDFGAKVDGYHADETRTVIVGRPATWQVEIFDVVRQAQLAGRDAARAGVGLREVDAAARDVIAGAGFGEEFGHGLGHGVGLEIHEAPLMGPRAEGMLHAGSPVTVEPGVYLPGRGGVRIEDIVLVTAGPSEPLTRSDRSLISVG